MRYSIWDLSLGKASDWYTSDAEGTDPLDALRRTVARASSHYLDAFGDGHIVVVANEKGGHGQATIFRIKRKPQALPDANYVQEVLI